jgi:hypothetical protein
MALPILEQIIDHLAATIATVTTGNGYTVTVSAVYRPATLGDFGRTPPGDYVVQIIQDDPQEDPEIGYSSNPPRVGWSQPVQLDLLYRPSDGATESLQQRLNIFEAAVIKAIMTDPTRGGLAIDSANAPGKWWVDPALGICSKTIVHTIRYRHKENDPTTA